MKNKLSIRGARVHNLKNIDVDLPKNSLVVLTGLSGSGKSSLAFDTIYAEGQRRYVESLSAYARQFLGQMEKPDVDSIEGLSPAISIDQKTTSKNPRSTVGTVTEVHDYLRLLWARVGKAHCPNCKEPLSSQTEESLANSISNFKETITLLAPLVEGRKGEHQKVFEKAVKDGYSRVEVDGEIFPIEEVPALDKQKKHSIFLVIDRLKPEGQRLRESLRVALEEGEGEVVVLEGEERQRFSLADNCPKCGRSAPKMEPRLFSYNSPYGACPDCQGLGYREVIDPDLILPDPTLSIDEGALEPFLQNASRVAKKLYFEVADKHKVPTNVPWQELPKKKKDVLLKGDTHLYSVSVRSRFGGNRVYKDIPFPGILKSLESKHSGTNSAWKKERIEKMMSLKACPACKGARLSPDALAVEVGGKNIEEVSSLPIDKTLAWFESLKLSRQETKIARLLLREIKERLHFLDNVGLYYLSLDRSARTLSGGEAQRIRLATQIGSALSGVLYVLDEPSIGLHQKDNDKLLATLKKLRDLGNSVIVVEHDEATMLEADWVVDLGPGAGRHGGEIIFAGTPSQIKRSSSLTGKYLSGKEKIEVPGERQKPTGEIKIKGATEHNLKNLNVSIPLGVQTCITGVSGSGKSTLIGDILYPALSNRLNKSTKRVGAHKKIEGAENIKRVIEIDQSPIGRTPRSNPATYTGTFDLIRSLFAEVPESRSRGYKPGRFSFNVEGGRCEACKGDGQIRIEMHFLPDVFVPCQACRGKRYNKETLEIKYRGKNIADTLEMSVSEALSFFQKIPRIQRRLKTLEDVGLGYIHLGQPATELSGGEAQRVKLATELSKIGKGDTLYILDEPTTGLHFEDVRKLLLVLRRLVEKENSVLLIEHNLDVIASSDWIVDLGPEGGVDGGEVVAEGTPEDVAKVRSSYTGKYIKEHL